MNDLIDDDLQRRTDRLFGGSHRTDDLDRLVLGLRSRAGSRDCFREIGDFVAHRDQRQKGPVTQIARDVFTSLEVWSLGLRGKSPTWADIERAARANLRIASEEQLMTGCGCSRATAHQKLDRAFKKIGREQRLKESEANVLTYLGNRFIWKPAFSSDQLFSEFVDVLEENGISYEREQPTVPSLKTFVTLYALSLMHGSAIVLESGNVVMLSAGFANERRVLEVKANFSLPDFGKPVTAPVCLFLTDLHPEDHCEDDLLERDDLVLPDQWAYPIEIGKSGRLARIS